MDHFFNKKCVILSFVPYINFIGYTKYKICFRKGIPIPSAITNMCLLFPMKSTEGILTFTLKYIYIYIYYATTFKLIPFPSLYVLYLLQTDCGPGKNRRFIFAFVSININRSPLTVLFTGVVAAFDVSTPGVINILRKLLYQYSELSV